MGHHDAPSDHSTPLVSLQIVGGFSEGDVAVMIVGVVSVVEEVASLAVGVGERVIV